MRKPGAHASFGSRVCCDFIGSDRAGAKSILQCDHASRNEYRECLYAKSKSGRYAHGERDSDFGLIGECRNQWVAYMDVCAKSGFDNRTCVMKSRLVIHAILNLTGK